MKYLALLVISMISGLALGENQDPLGLKPKKLILSIGVGEFQDDLWHPLKFAPKDASDVYEKFTKGVGFDGGQLVNGQKVSKEDIEKAIDRLDSSNLNEDDTVIVYVSSHGTILSELGGVSRQIVTSQTDSQNLKKTSVSYQWLMDRFKKLKSRKKVLILAFCYSGTGKSGLTRQMRQEMAQMKGFFQEPIQEASEGSIILTASGWREPALEMPELENDLYTHFLLKGFDQDSNGDGAVSITEAHTFAAQATYAYSNGRQRPSAITELLGSDPIIVAGKVKKKAPPMLFAYLGSHTKYQILIDGSDMGPVAKGLSVPEGTVRLTIKDPDNEKVVVDRAVTLESGREYPIARFLNPIFPNTLTFGVQQLAFQGRDIRKGYAPETATGAKIRYFRDEALWIYDLGIEASYINTTNETFETEGIDFKQDRKMLTLNLLMGFRNKLKVLSATDRSWITEARFFAGPSVLMIDRHVKEESFDQPKTRTTAGGLVSGVGIETLIPYNLIKFGVEAQLAGHRNFAEEGKPMVLSSHLSAYVGTFW